VKGSLKPGNIKTYVVVIKMAHCQQQNQIHKGCGVNNYGSE